MELDTTKTLERILQHFPKTHLDQTTKTVNYAWQAIEKTAPGELGIYQQQGLQVAEILLALELDHEAILASLLHPAIFCGALNFNQLQQNCSPSQLELLKGISRMYLIQNNDNDNPEPIEEGVSNLEDLRKMLLAMVQDVRVVLITLAEQLNRLRNAKNLAPADAKRLSQNSLNIFTPLANRLGVWQIKWEMEDLAFRYLNPEIYHDIAQKLASRRTEREKYLNKFIGTLNDALEEVAISARVYGRPKHIYSIWNKMRKKKLPFEEIFDVLAVRILTDSIQDCYAALGVVHTKWSYISGEFDDYIATPKPNNYRSIHSAIIGPNGYAIEVQIRTHEMHEFNELGVAAHWRYKEGNKKDQSMDKKIAWLRQVMEWKNEISDAGEFIERFKDETFEDRVYVFTPAGKIIDLPEGATPIDFAYTVHTEVGHRCRGAKIGGRMVPLTYMLQTGDKVEILTVKQGGPSRDWLLHRAGFIKTQRARQRIQQWFKKQNVDEKISQGRHLLEKEFQRMGLQEISFEKLVKRLKLTKPDELFMRVADGEIKLTRILEAAQLTQPPPTKNEDDIQSLVKKTKSSSGALSIHGIGNLLTQIARCCMPAPGDPITGYITQGKGVSIHKEDCRNLLQKKITSPERIIEVSWQSGEQSFYPIDMSIEAYDRQGLLRDITATLTDSGLNVVGINTHTDKKTHMTRMNITVEVKSVAEISRVLNQIKHIPNVSKAERKVNH